MDSIGIASRTPQESYSRTSGPRTDFYSQSIGETAVTANRRGGGNLSRRARLSREREEARRSLGEVRSQEDPGNQHLARLLAGFRLGG